MYGLLAAVGQSVPPPEMPRPQPPASRPNPSGDPPPMSTTPAPSAADAAPSADPVASADPGGAVDLADALRAKMAAAGLDNQAAALAIGIPPGVLSRMLLGQCLPSETTVPRLAAWLGIDAARLPRSTRRPDAPAAPIPAPADRARRAASSRRAHGASPARRDQAAPTMVNRPLADVLAAVRAALLPPPPPAPMPPVLRNQLAMAVHAAPAPASPASATAGRPPCWRLPGSAIALDPEQYAPRAILQAWCDDADRLWLASRMILHPVAITSKCWN